jgi:hypothetical protein
MSADSERDAGALAGVDLNYPWDIARAGNRFILTETAGSIVMIENGRATSLCCPDRQ